MKFLRNTSLRLIGIYLLVVMFLIYFAEYYIIQHRIDVLDEVEQKLDFTRSAELSSQQISLLVQRHLAHNEDLTVEIEAKIVHQEHLLEILGKGGRVDRTDVILKPLSRLPKISYDNLKEYWEEYKASVRDILALQHKTPSTTDQAQVPVQSTTDSTTSTPAVATPTEVKPVVSAKMLAAAALKEESLSLTLSQWYDNLFDDLETEVWREKSSVHGWVIAIIIFDVALLTLIFFAFNKYVLEPINKLRLSTANHQQVTNTAPNEIGKLSEQINETLENLKDATDFVTAIGQGNLDMDYKASLDSRYNHGKNKLADSLIDMQGKLKSLNEEERKRQWANEGLAKFVDILRSSNDNIVALSDKVIAALAQYTKSNQGALYIYNDDDEYNKHLELVSLFAFDIKKYETRKIKLGEGLLGQTFLEGETNYYTNFPDEYIRITSGLGDANPRSILIVPLKVDTQIYGIVELASFNEYAPHEIAFVEKLGETIASTIGSVKAAEKNKDLIEQFQTQTEQMRAQEEEMRQNMEELQATQEEVARKERGYIERIQELEQQSVNSSVTTDKLEEVTSDFIRKERDHLEKINALEKQLSQKPEKADDWQIAEEVVQTLKINLKALEITQEELNRKLK
ncbi:GAF domain-containing protein [Ohtaekwangia koreensis]|uniref:GAF domain-containing protein n=1 Tax=Ohtaekwangia koreensis TaxID=688867 RepID=A0A1T5J1E7_9BACT|nr:GAF domain-containing protein [Ohtaekwangia koreensis]SKC45058.1 GAF domain-containing protein [Ohtaekwangia koreensis]